MDTAHHTTQLDYAHGMGTICGTENADMDAAMPVATTGIAH